jgi:cyd operon protein YbgE
VNRWHDNAWTRAISLWAAITIMLLVTLLPRGLTRADGSAVNHVVLSLVMWGLSAGFVYGIGFVPRARVLRFVFSPFVAWLGMGVAVVLYVRYFSY